MNVGLFLIALSTTALVTTEQQNPGLLSEKEHNILKTECFLQNLYMKLASESKTLLTKITKKELAKFGKSNLVKKRSVSAQSSGHNRWPAGGQADHCCLDTVEIDFHTIDWNFILSPRKLQFSFCRGSCNPHIVRPSLFTKAAASILYVSKNQQFGPQIIIGVHFL